MKADSSPRSARGLVAGAFGLYRRYPLIFLVLAAGVVVPYLVIVLVATGSGPLEPSSSSVGTTLLLALIQWVLIAPLISALHVHAVREAREGHDPRLAPVALQGLRVLPVVVAASIVSGLGIAAGLLLFVVPGIVLMLRWYVVAQSAAIEHEGWLPALRRSHQLTQGHYGHVFVFSIYVAVIVSAPLFLAELGFGEDSTTVASFLVGLVVQAIAWSFGALATALLYFDLRARREASLAQSHSGGVPVPVGDGAPRVEHSLDPREYSDQDRPKGWYIDPNSPDRMRYWSAGDPPGWGGTTRTPRRIRRDWQAQAEAELE